MQKAKGRRQKASDLTSAIYLLPSTSTFAFYLLLPCAPWRRILLRLVVEHEHPVHHLAFVGRCERPLAGVWERADALAAPVRGLNHHALIVAPAIALMRTRNVRPTGA